MSDGERSGKQVLLKAEVPDGVAKELDRLAAELNFSTRAGLLRHIVIDFIKGPKTTTFSDFERMAPGQGFRGQTQDIDMSELTAVLHTLNKSMDQSAAQINIIARQNETIHQLVDQNDKLTQTTLWGNERPALPEPTPVRCEPEPEDEPEGEDEPEDEPEPEPLPPPPINAPHMKMAENNRQPLTGGEIVSIKEAVVFAKALGVSISRDTIDRATQTLHGEILLPVPDQPVRSVYTRDLQAFLDVWPTFGKLPRMPKIRDGKAI